MSSPRTIRVDLAGRAYDIAIGPGLIDRAGELSRPLLAAPRVTIVSDDTVEPIYGARLAASFAKAGIKTETVTVPAGESSKDFASFGRLMNELLDRRPDRKTTLVALGGGVVGDLTGFAAAVLLRGVDFIQVPTTLLAQVDSSVGGKTGINTRHGKNLVGAFYQPVRVVCDLDVLATLPAREYSAGLAEVIKYGPIADEAFLGWIEDNLESPLSLEKVSERSGYSKWHLQRMFKKETGHSLGQYIRSRKMTEIAQKLKESNEPILYLAERYGFESQQTLTRTFKNYFDVPPHKYRMTNMQGESRFLHPLNHYNS